VSLVFRFFEAFLGVNLVKSIYSIATVTLIVVLSAFTAFAQETEETIVDEVVAQVNDSVITLSQVRREKKNIVDQFMGQGKTREEAEAEVQKNEGQLIANLITEEMMRQKGVEIGIDKAVETEVNQRLLKLVKDNKLTTINELYTVMKSQGVEPELLKESWRADIMKQQVFNQFVDRVVYWETSDQEIKDYFNANKDKFLQKEQVGLSEIFLTFAGKNEAEVESLAKALAKRAQNGEDFVELAKQYSDRPDVAQTNGVVGVFETEKLNADIKEAIKGLKTGQVAEPIKWDIGMEIVRIDKRTAASSETNFDEAAVRLKIMQEKAPDRRVKFIEDLRQDSYIKLRENYRGIVSPFLQKSETDSKSSVASTN